MHRIHYSTIFFLLLLTVQSCGEDGGSSCVTCTSSLTPNFEVCEESSGNASVNGQDTGTPYNAYISGLEEAGTSCGI